MRPTSARPISTKSCGCSRRHFLFTRTSNFSSSVQRSTPRTSSTFLAGIPPKLSIWKGRGSSATKCSLPRVKTPCLWRIWPDRERLWFELYARLPEEEKEFVEQSGDSLQVRVIISTNVAEASLTVEGVVYVVDSGLEFQGQWDRGTTSQKVVPVLISKANARQRWGRSGRTAEGEVYCPYAAKQFNELMLDYQTLRI